MFHRYCRIDTFIFGFRFPPYTDAWKKKMGYIYPTIPPRPKKTTEAASSGRKRWVMWFVCALVCGSSVLLTKYGPFVQLKA